MTGMREARVPGPNHPITLEPNPNRLIVRIAGRIVADTTDALTLREAGYPPVHYVPRRDIDMSLLTRSDRATHCPYKGDCSYFGLSEAGRPNAAWSYENPYPSVIAIREHLAFDASCVDSIDELTS